VSGARVQRWASILVGAGVVVFVGWLTAQQAGGHVRGASSPRPSEVADAGAPATTTTATTASSTLQITGVIGSDAGPSASDDAGLTFGALGLIDGGLAMPSGAPRSVHMGVVLVTYVGAEGASSNAKTKAEALAVAQRLHDQAKTDFKGAVKEGDSGSAEDIGRIPRGVLDPRAEVSVFSLAAGEISDVLETPKGFWIVKRLD
jgi:parvulin-like peptidyl-prolyl isomerase